MLFSSLIIHPVFAQDDQIFFGTSQDQRVARCGVRITGSEVAQIEPILEGQADLDGSVVLDVIKQSASGSSQSRQATQFHAGRLGRVRVSIDRPAQATIAMTVIDRSGKTLCEMRKAIRLERFPTKI